MDRKVTIYTIAEELGVTPTSVSRAFNPNARISAEKRERILETARKYQFEPNRMASRLSKREITIGVLIYSYFEQFYSELIRGIEDAYRDLKDYKVKYDLRLIDSKKNPATVCNEVLDEFRERRYDGIIVSDLLNDSNIIKINEIYETNPNIAFINFDSVKLHRLFASVHDFECASRAAAGLLSTGLCRSSRKNILLFTEDITAFAQMRAQNAFCAEAEQEGLKICGIYEIKDFNESLESGDPTARRILSDEIDGIFVSCGNSLSLCRTLEKMPPERRPVLITYDVFPELNRYIKDGVVTATVFQNSYMQARTAFTKLFFHLLDGQEIPSTVYTKFELVMKNNLVLYE